MMNNTLIDNSAQFRLVDYLNKLTADEGCKEICIATGYWDLKGTKLLYDTLLPFFKREGRLRLLIGEEPRIRSYQYDEPETPSQKFPDFYIQRDVNLLTEEYAPVAKMLLKYAKIEEPDNSQIQIRVYGQHGDDKKFLHAKCYIFLGQGQAYGIIGSSNFTEKGLQGNAELNHLEVNPNSVTGAITEYNPYKTHLTWFNEMWNDESCENWTGVFIKDILKKAPVANVLPQPEPVLEPEKLSPYEVYIKYLQMQFGDIADSNTDAILKSYLPKENFDMLTYQFDAVKQCFYIMKQHKGFFLSDVVGLGKTVVGTLIIRKYIAEAASLDNRKPYVLLIAPPSIKPSWEEMIERFDADSATKIGDYVDIVSSGSVKNIGQTESIGDAEEECEDEIEVEGTSEIGSATRDYGLIIIDESHNFRNSRTQKYKTLTDLIDRISAKNPQPYVGLLSATPQNNAPEDLKNQIYLFQRQPQNTTLPDIPEGKLDSYFQKCEKTFNGCRNSMSDESREELKQLAADIRKRVLDNLVIRRTRTDLKLHYTEDADRLRFPTVVGPHKLEYQMGKNVRELFIDTMTKILPDDPEVPDGKQHIGYYRYMAIGYLKDAEDKRRYEYRNLDVERIGKQLARIMQILLVKRLESSFVAFKESLHNLCQYTKNMIDMLEYDGGKGAVYICPSDSIDVNAVFAEHNGDIEAVIKTLDKKIAKIEDEKERQKNRRYDTADFGSKYIERLREDYDLLTEMCKKWDNLKYDPKMDCFKRKVAEELMADGINNPDRSKGDEKKLVIFTEAIATQKEIAEYLEEARDEIGFKGDVLTVSAENRNDMRNKIRANFDAKYEGEEKNDYNIIVTTEVLAEGVNLHRANVILNYDTPWNATRLMQRIGRVNRLGSRQKEVHVFNFFPSDQGNEYIRLKEKAYAKLQSFHTMFGEDSRIFSEAEEIGKANFNKLIDGEESPMAQHIAALKEYQAENTERYEALKVVEPREIGGIVEVEEGEGDRKGLGIVSAAKSGSLCIVVEDGKARVGSAVEAMDILRCGEGARWAEESEDMPEDMKKEVLDQYNLHCSRHINKGDVNKEQKEAMMILKGIQKEMKTEGSKKAYKTAKQAIEEKNLIVMKKVQELGRQQQAGLFGIEYDFSSWMEAVMDQMAKNIAEKKGEAYVSIWEKPKDNLEN